MSSQEALIDINDSPFLIFLDKSKHENQSSFRKRLRNKKKLKIRIGKKGKKRGMIDWTNSTEKSFQILHFKKACKLWTELVRSLAVEVNDGNWKKSDLLSFAKIQWVCEAWLNVKEILRCPCRNRNKMIQKTC